MDVVQAAPLTTRNSSMDAIRLHLERLQPFLRYCDEVLTANGQSDAERAETITHYTGARCCGCGLIVTGAELETFVTQQGSPSEKLTRIRQGYCGRSTCNSYFYEVTLQQHPTLDWPKLIASFQAQEAAATPEKRRIRIQRPELTAKHWMLAGALFLVIGLWIGRNWWISGKLPGMSPRYRFHTVVPSPSLTNATDRR